MYRLSLSHGGFKQHPGDVSCRFGMRQEGSSLMHILKARRVTQDRSDEWQ